MAINVYCGLPGSGKSYEVVSEVVVPQYGKGRRIVTNIDGINEELIADYCADKLGLPAKNFGSILHVTDPQVEQPDFFPSGDAALPSIVQRGDIVVIDEAWRFWGSGEGSLPPRHLEFFRMHRHYTGDALGPDGRPLCCDLVLMTQDINDLHGKLKRVVEFSARFKKHKWAGLTSRYVVNTWEGYQQRNDPLARVQKKYNPEIFPLYRSYSGGVGAEAVVDSRQNAISFKMKLALATSIVLLPVSAVAMFVEFRHLTAHGAGAARSAVADRSRPAVGMASADPRFSRALPVLSGPYGQASLVSGASGVLPGQAYDQAQDRADIRRRMALYQRPVPGPAPLSSTWRLAGFSDLPSGRVVMVADPSGRLRYQSPSECEWVGGAPSICTVDGERITPFSGSLLGAQSPSGQPAPPPDRDPPGQPAQHRPAVPGMTEAASRFGL